MSETPFKTNNIKVTSPKGQAKYPWITKPNTRFNAAGDYCIDLIVPAEECTEFCNLLDETMKECFAEATEGMKPAKAKTVKIHPPYSMELDEETGEETGNVVFKFKQAATFTNTKGETVNVTIGLFDAGGEKITSPVAIGNGSTVRVAGVMRKAIAQNICYVSLKLKAVKILELVEYSGGGNASSYGFDGDDGGSYEAPAGGSGFSGDEDDDF